MDVIRVSEDGLSRVVWSFLMPGRQGLVLTGVSTERRPSGKGRWPSAPPRDRWSSRDERPYNSGQPRPTAIPADVIEDAARQIELDVYIGWTNSESHIGSVRMSDLKGGDA